MLMQNRSRRFVAMCLFLVMLLPFFTSAVADDSQVKASAYYEDAVKLYNQQKYNDAVIQLRNALQQNTRLLPAIVLLGKTYLQTGNPAAAESAFDDAINAGADLSIVVIPRAQAFVAQFKQDLLLAERIPNGLPGQVLAELHTIRAQAALVTNNQKALSEELISAKAAEPDNADLIFLELTIALNKGEIVEAERLLRRLKILYPDQQNTLLAIASVSHKKGILEGALDEYSTLISAYPKNVEARIARVGLLFDLGRHNEAKPDIDMLVEQAASDPRVNYLKATKLEVEGDVNGRREALIEVVEVLDALDPGIVKVNPQFAMIGGMANFKLDKPEQARVYLENYIKMGGNDPDARTMLAKIYADAGEYRETLYLTEALLDQGRLNMELIKLTANAYHAIGEHRKAVVLLERITRLLSNSTALNVELALSRVKAGFSHQGIAELEALYISKDTRKYTAMPLAVTYLDVRQFDQAYTIARDLLKTEPENISYINLLGLVEVGRGNLELARKQFEQVLLSDPDSVSAHINLAKLDVDAGEFAPAIERLNRLAEKNRDNTQVMLELSRIHGGKGDVRKALNWARKAYKAAPESLFVNKNLIELLIATGDLRDAQSIALELEQQRPDNLNVLEINARVLEAQGEINQLRSHYREMAQLAALNPEWLVKIADYQASVTGDLEDASYTLFKALQENPDNLDARIMLTDIEVRLSRLESAQARAKAIITDHPDRDAGYLLLADTFMALQNYPQAIENYSKANDKNRQTGTLLKLYTAQRRNGELSAAYQSLADWLIERPGDRSVRTALAEYYLGTGSPDKAREEYVRLFKQGIETPGLLNNMANTLIKLNDLESALDYARKAHAIDASDPFINDTLGWVLTLRNQHEEGIGYLREAIIRASNNPEMRYHLAVNLAAQKRTRESIYELKTALDSNTDFDGREDARALLLRISNKAEN